MGARVSGGAVTRGMVLRVTRESDGDGWMTSSAVEERFQLALE